MAGSLVIFLSAVLGAALQEILKWYDIYKRLDFKKYDKLIKSARYSPNLQKLLDDIRVRKIDVIVVYKVDRLTRSLADFAKLVELFDAHGVSFVSVTQQFNTTTSMGRSNEAPGVHCTCWRRSRGIAGRFYRVRSFAPPSPR